MKTIFFFLFNILLAVSLAGQSYTASSFKVNIKGTSNLHDWTSNVNEVRADADIAIGEDGHLEVRTLKVVIPVYTIKSLNGKIMDNKTYAALKASKYPNIVYKMVGVHSSKFDGNKHKISISGKLTIAGVTRTVGIYAVGTPESDGSITFRGSEKIKMTDYKVKPPTALLGTLTTGDQVEVVFKLKLKKN